MKRFIRLAIISAFACMPSFLLAQKEDIYDYTHSLKFANYLFENGDYEFAAKEYYRIFSVESAAADTLINIRFAKSLFHSGQYQQLQNIFDTKYNKEGIPCYIKSTYLKSIILSSPTLELSTKINQDQCFSKQEQSYYLLANKLLHYQFTEAHSYYDQNKNIPDLSIFAPTLKAIEQAKYKKPWLSFLMSAVIPGTGKAYCGFWKDGLFSFFMIGMSSWQAYSGFHKKGIGSVYGWVGTSLATAFYAGNLYGSVKAANQYNYLIDHEIHHKAEAIFLLPD